MGWKSTDASIHEIDEYLATCLGDGKALLLRFCMNLLDIASVDEISRHYERVSVEEVGGENKPPFSRTLSPEVTTITSLFYHVTPSWRRYMNTQACVRRWVGAGTSEGACAWSPLLLQANSTVFSTVWHMACFLSQNILQIALPAREGSRPSFFSVAPILHRRDGPVSFT